MLELCKSVLSFLLFNCIFKKNAKSSGYERYRDRAIKEKRIYYYYYYYYCYCYICWYRNRQVCNLSFKQKHCACLRLSWDNLIRMFCQCFYFAGDAGHVDDKLNLYNLDKNSESSKCRKLTYFQSQWEFLYVKTILST